MAKKWTESCQCGHCKTCANPAQVEWRQKIASAFDVPDGFVDGSWRCPEVDITKLVELNPDAFPKLKRDLRNCQPCKDKMLAQMKADEAKQLAPKPPAKRLRFVNKQSPGDVVVMTAVVRDLHIANPDQFLTEIDGTGPAIWENNPYVTKPDGSHAEPIVCEYPLVHESDRLPRHFIEGYHGWLSNRLGVAIPLTQFKGDIYLSDQEKSWMNQVDEQHGWKKPFWIMICGGKMDFTAKWWNPKHAQEVVDYFQGRIKFVQVGELGHFHYPLQGAINLIGKTDLRQLIRLVYHAAGIVCPVTMAVHLAAAVPTKTPGFRPCVVVAGGREPAQWEQYPGHQFLHTIGALACCSTKACWRSRCQKMHDGDPKDVRDLCDRPVTVTEGLQVPACMNMITAGDVCRAIERYYEGGVLKYEA